MSNETEENPRYLRFLRSLLMGSALAAAPLTAASCTDEEEECVDEECSNSPDPDAMVDAGVVVDGPLPPPDLPKLA